MDDTTLEINFLNISEKRKFYFLKDDDFYFFFNRMQQYVAVLSVTFLKINVRCFYFFFNLENKVRSRAWNHK